LAVGGGRHPDGKGWARGDGGWGQWCSALATVTLPGLEVARGLGALENKLIRR